MSGQKTFTRLWFNLKSISCGVVHQGKSGLLLLEVSQGDAHGVNFTSWSQPEVKFQVQRPRKIHRLLRLPEWEKILTVKSNGGISPWTRAQSHKALLEVHHHTKRLDDRPTTQHRRLALQEEHLGVAIGT